MPRDKREDFYFSLFFVRRFYKRNSVSAKESIRFYYA